MNIPAEFNEIRPYTPEELPQIYEELIADPAFRTVVESVMPGVPFEGLAMKMRQCKTNLEFQKAFFYGLLWDLVKKTANGLTFDCSALSDLTRNYTFISNHRDIILDSAFLSILLIDNGMTTVEIAIGDNLLIYPWIHKLVRVNKSFIVKRGLNMRQKLEASALMSRYMHFAMKEKHENLWIAQRQGRAKDSNDRTQDSVLKMMAKAGWFLLNDKMARVNMEFNHDVNYQGLFYLEEALLNGQPEGLKVFGGWPTIYEGLSQLPEQVQKSWFGFDHFYSDNSFSQALEIVFLHSPKRLLDIGGNTGRWATRCVQYNQEVEVTIVDLPQQLEMMRKQTAGLSGSERIHGHGANLLDRDVPFPTGFDAVWMSQFLDCFSEEEVISILTRVAQSIGKDSKVYIMETLWDRQRYETASYCLTQISLYFTAMANGNSKMFHSDDLIRCIENAGLEVEEIQDNIGLGHSILQCRLK